MASERMKLIEELKQYRESLSKETIISEEKKGVQEKGKQKVFVKQNPNGRGYTDAVILALLTGLASGIMIGIVLMVTNIIG